MEGMRLLRLKRQIEDANYLGWVDWFDANALRTSGPDRRVRYRHDRLALEAVRDNVGLLVCGLALVLDDLAAGRVVNPFLNRKSLPAPHTYRVLLREDVKKRPQIQRFVDCLAEKARDTHIEIDQFRGVD